MKSHTPQAHPARVLGGPIHVPLKASMVIRTTMASRPLMCGKNSFRNPVENFGVDSSNSFSTHRLFESEPLFIKLTNFFEARWQGFHGIHVHFTSHTPSKPPRAWLRHSSAQCVKFKWSIPPILDIVIGIHGVFNEIPHNSTSASSTGFRRADSCLPLLKSCKNICQRMFASTPNAREK